jgi:hypothetical protein
MDCHTDPIYDYAVMIVSPLKGRHIGAVTGGDGITWNQSKRIKSIRIVGYTDGYSKPQYAVTNTATVTENKQPFRSGNASGLGEGTSGGPWFKSAIKRGVGIIAGVANTQPRRPGKRLDCSMRAPSSQRRPPDRSDTGPLKAGWSLPGRGYRCGGHQP